jgi:hypothetical protein
VLRTAQIRHHDSSPYLDLVAWLERHGCDAKRRGRLVWLRQTASATQAVRLARRYHIRFTHESGGPWPAEDALRTRWDADLALRDDATEVRRLLSAFAALSPDAQRHVRFAVRKVLEKHDGADTRASGLWYWWIESCCGISRSFARECLTTTEPKQRAQRTENQVEFNRRVAALFARRHK